MTPSRLGLLIAALLILSSALLVASMRYPDEEHALTIERATEIVEAGGYADCFPSAEDPDRPCAAAHLHNFAARARLLGAATAAAVMLVFLAFAIKRDRVVDHASPAAGTQEVPRHEHG